MFINSIRGRVHVPDSFASVFTTRTRIGDVICGLVKLSQRIAEEGRRPGGQKIDTFYCRERIEEIINYLFATMPAEMCGCGPADTCERCGEYRWVTAREIHQNGRRPRSSEPSPDPADRPATPSAS
jgi:hypothetical protein